MKSKDTLHYFDKLYNGLLMNVDERGDNIALTVGVTNMGRSSVLMSLLRLGKQQELIPKQQGQINVRPISKKKNKKKGRAQLRREACLESPTHPGKCEKLQNIHSQINHERISWMFRGLFFEKDQKRGLDMVQRIYYQWENRQ